MTITITLNTATIETLDLSPVQPMVEQWLRENTIANYAQQVRFDIHYDPAVDGEQELSEIPEVRLWFIRLDSCYPWMPFLLDWQGGELARYAAMLIPHQFTAKEGIQYNPEALDIFIMQKVFILMDWLSQQGIDSEAKLKNMAQLFGYELDSGLFALIRSSSQDAKPQ